MRRGDLRNTDTMYALCLSFYTLCLLNGVHTLCRFKKKVRPQEKEKKKKKEKICLQMSHVP